MAETVGAAGLTLPICTSCRTPIIPNEKGTKFFCPKCSVVIIWRCSKCRKTGTLYRCPNCGFEGP